MGVDWRLSRERPDDGREEAGSEPRTAMGSDGAPERGGGNVIYTSHRQPPWQYISTTDDSNMVDCRNIVSYAHTHQAVTTRSISSQHVNLTWLSQRF